MSREELKGSDVYYLIRDGVIRDGEETGMPLLYIGVAESVPIA
jgi:hypothetical protein